MTRLSHHRNRLALVVFIVLSVFMMQCGNDEANQAYSSESNIKLLNDLNAKNNDGKIIRFAKMPIKVFIDNVPSAKDQVLDWEKATDGLISFKFVDADPGVGISIKNGISPPPICGATFSPEWDSTGAIKKSAISMPLQGHVALICRKTIKHEIGHALGIFGHTEDGGLMDPDGGNGKFTQQLLEIMTVLYSSPPGTEIHEAFANFEEEEE